MHHVITIPKKDYPRGITRLELALGIFNQNNNACLAVDSSGNYYEVSVINSTRQRAEQMKYFAIGFLNAPELE